MSCLLVAGEFILDKDITKNGLFHPVAFTYRAHKAATRSNIDWFVMLFRLNPLAPSLSLFVYHPPILSISTGINTLPEAAITMPSMLLYAHTWSYKYGRQDTFTSTIRQAHHLTPSPGITHKALTFFEKDPVSVPYGSSFKSATLPLIRTPPASL